MRPFFDASEFPRPTFVKEENRYQGLRYNCTLNLPCPNATLTTECGGVCEKYVGQDVWDKEKSKSNAGVVNKGDDRKSTRGKIGCYTCP
jgi:hypothetical protein